jgi:hypothetical protein
MIVCLLGCKDYHKDMREWVEAIPSGTIVEKVKAQQPDYLEIDWNHPIAKENGVVWYRITTIKGHQDPVPILFYIEFNSQGLIGHGWERVAE